jgi:pimeloyl-ACP methyl ester carboxylesterase
MEEEELEQIIERPAGPHEQEAQSVRRPEGHDRAGALDDANDDMMGHAPGAALTREQLARAAVREQMAHGGAYRGEEQGDNVALPHEEGATNLNPMLRANGFQENPTLIRGNDGLEMVVYHPEPGSGNAPVIAFRGSQEPIDWVGDTDADQVGDAQYESNRALIDRTMSDLASQYPDQPRPELTGHSLGGAIAQRVAADHLDQAGHITTFQAPGITADQVERIEAYNREHPDSPITADHFRAEGDVVPLAGEGHAPGTVHTTAVDPDETPYGTAVGGMLAGPGGAIAGTLGVNAAQAHRAYIATPYALQTEEGRAALPHLLDEDGNVREEVADSFYVEGGLQSEEVDESPNDPGRFVAENLRQGVGVVVHGALDAAESGIEHMDETIDAQHRGIDRIQRGAIAANDMGDAAVDTAQDAVSTVNNATRTAVNRGQRAANNLENAAQAGTDSVQNDVNRNVSDVVGERAANLALAPANAVVDTAQAATHLSMSGANTVIDTAQRGAQVVENTANTVVDTAQNANRAVVRTGQAVVDRGQAAVRGVQQGAQDAVHGAWDWLTT